MEIYFFRHGIAVDREDPSYPIDRDRPLTKEGIEKTREAARGLMRLGIAFDGILTSPWIRASQTAAILAKTLKMETVENLAELEGDRSASDLVAALRARRESSLLIVGHEPLLSTTMARLLSPAADLMLDLKKSGVGALEIESFSATPKAKLLWLLTAKQLRCMAK